MLSLYLIIILDANSHPSNNSLLASNANLIGSFVATRVCPMNVPASVVNNFLIFNLLSERLVWLLLHIFSISSLVLLANVSNNLIAIF